LFEYLNALQAKTKLQGDRKLQSSTPINASYFERLSLHIEAIRPVFFFSAGIHETHIKHHPQKREKIPFSDWLLFGVMWPKNDVILPG